MEPRRWLQIQPSSPSKPLHLKIRIVSFLLLNQQDNQSSPPTPIPQLARFSPCCIYLAKQKSCKPAFFFFFHFNIKWKHIRTFFIHRELLSSSRRKFYSIPSPSFTSRWKIMISWFNRSYIDLLFLHKMDTNAAAGQSWTTEFSRGEKNRLSSAYSARQLVILSLPPI